MKICGSCKVEKNDSEFRTRKDGRPGRECTYLNNYCIECDKIRARIYYAQKKDDPEFKEKNRIRARQYQHANPDKIKSRKSTQEFKQKHAAQENARYYKMKDIVSAKMKIKRQTPEYKEMMRAYRCKNKEKIAKQELITKRRYHEKHRDKLTDEYIIRQLISQGVATRESLKIHPEIIEAKRIQLLIKRKVNADTN